MSSKYSLEPSPMEVADRLGSRVAALRKQKNWTQTELAARSGVTLGSLRRFEQTGEIALGKLLRLLHVLGRLNDMANILELREDPTELNRWWAEMHKRDTEDI